MIRHIIRQGEVGDTFYVIDEGVAAVTRTDEHGVEQHIRKLHEYRYTSKLKLLVLLHYKFAVAMIA
jgi:CRP-like cAMP-binding protein